MIKRVLLCFAVLMMMHLACVHYPTIIASFDDVKYVDGEVFTPVNGEYDFKKFSLNSSQTENYKTFITCSGYARLIDSGGNHYVQVFEWDKMTSAQREKLNSSFLFEQKNPSHVRDGIRIVDIDLWDGTLHGAYAYDSKSNTLVYIVTPQDRETVEMIQTLEFKD